VEIRPQREFPRLRQPCARRLRRRDDCAQYDRAPMRRDFDDVFAGVGMGSGEVRRDRAIDRGAVGAPDGGQRGAARLERRAAAQG
jgi:hypothetical protein